MARNLSIDRHYLELSRRHTPRHRFAGSTRAQWQAWREALRPAVIDTLGDAPPTCDLNAQVEVQWVEDGLIKQRIIFDVEPGLSARAYLFRPEHAQGPLPAILCCHGHGVQGKETVMGNRSTPELRTRITELNYDYGLQMAKAGFVTCAIDWRGFGERDDRRKPHCHDIQRTRDICNTMYLRATVLGQTVLGQDIHDGRRTLDLLCAQDFVDPDRLGVMGLSFGGTMTTWMSICDDRLKAADIICYADRFADFLMRDLNACGSQVTPGLFTLCDVPDLHGLIAPRPLLIEIGVHDQCFLVDSALSCFNELEKIYHAAEARDRLELDLFPGPHAWGGNKSVDFFRRHL